MVKGNEVGVKAKSRPVRSGENFPLAGSSFILHFGGAEKTYPTP